MEDVGQATDPPIEGKSSIEVGCSVYVSGL